MIKRTTCFVTPVGNKEPSSPAGRRLDKNGTFKLHVGRKNICDLAPKWSEAFKGSFICREIRARITASVAQVQKVSSFSRWRWRTKRSLPPLTWSQLRGNLHPAVGRGAAMTESPLTSERFSCFSLTRLLGSHTHTSSSETAARFCQCGM